MYILIVASALILFGLCMSTDRLIEARSSRRQPHQDQVSYL
jgi:hypothetical protein